MTQTYSPVPTPVPAGGGGAGAPSPLSDAAWMVRLIGSVTGEPEDVVLSRLQAEYRRPGTSVSADFAKRGLEPYRWGEGLARFYGETDAFLYELAVWNRNWFKMRLRAAVVRFVSGESLRRRRPVRVLSIGDGLGFDALALARAGHDVTYYELPGRSERFARKLFAEADATVTVITDLGAAAAESFDAVACLDVLEHAPDPSAVVRDVISRLRPGGLALFSAPFFLILPWYPTHLKSNRHHSGSAALYHQFGLHLVDGSWTWAPLVLRKPSPSRDLPVNWNKLSLIALAGPFMAAGRWMSWPFAVCHLLRRVTNRWFAPVRS
jgi:SAM-dependent methyltransferase